MTPPLSVSTMCRHVDGTAAQGVLAKGHSKDKRPDLLQFKQSLGTLDPAGIPLLTETLSGQVADDPLYLPAWQRMTETIGHTQFLFVADCKAGLSPGFSTRKHPRPRFLCISMHALTAVEHTFHKPNG